MTDLSLVEIAERLKAVEEEVSELRGLLAVAALPKPLTDRIMAALDDTPRGARDVTRRALHDNERSVRTILSRLKHQGYASRRKKGWVKR